MLSGDEGFTVLAPGFAESKSMAKAVRVTREAKRQELRQWKRRAVEEALEVLLS